MSRFPSSKCPICPLFSRLPYFVGKDPLSPSNAKIAVVGEAPGEQEAAKGRPFVGKSGELLDHLLAKAGIPRSTVLASNVLKCRPKDNKLPEGDDLELAIDCCSEILTKDLEGVEVVIGLGNIPLKAFTGLSKITVRRGSVYELEDGRPYIATLHPAFLIRSSFVQKGDTETKTVPPEVVVADIKRARRIVEGEEWRTHEYYILDPTSEELDNFLVRLYQPERMVTLDIETPKVAPRYAIPTVVGLMLDDVGVCVDFETELLFIKDALASPTPKNTQNGIFDFLVLKNLGFAVKEWQWDTLYMHHLLYAELSHKLEFIQSLHSWLPYHKNMRQQLSAFNDSIEEVYDK